MSILEAAAYGATDDPPLQKLKGRGPAMLGDFLRGLPLAAERRYVADPRPYDVNQETYRSALRGDLSREAYAGAAAQHGGTRPVDDLYRRWGVAAESSGEGSAEEVRARSAYQAALPRPARPTALALDERLDPSGVARRSSTAVADPGRPRFSPREEAMMLRLERLGMPAMQVEASDDPRNAYNLTEEGRIVLPRSETARRDLVEYINVAENRPLSIAPEDSSAAVLAHEVGHSVDPAIRRWINGQPEERGALADRAAAIADSLGVNEGVTQHERHIFSRFLRSSVRDNQLYADRTGEALLRLARGDKQPKGSRLLHHRVARVFDELTRQELPNVRVRSPKTLRESWSGRRD